MLTVLDLGQTQSTRVHLPNAYIFPEAGANESFFIFSICQVFPELRNVSQIYPKDWCFAFSTLLRSVNLPPEDIYLYDMRLSLGFVWWSLVQLAHLQHLA